MRSVTLLIAASALLAACGEGTPSPDEQATIDEVLALTGDVEAGATVYSDNCASCHAADGSGGTGPSLIEEVPETSDEEIVDIVLFGREAMPDLGLENQEVADVLAYLRDTFGEYQGDD